MSDGFLGRWSRRKQAVQTGQPLDEAAPTSVAVPPLVPAPERRAEGVPPAADLPDGAAVAEVPVPTLEDAQALTPQSDFKPFMTHKVAPEVKNAAMKKLFADPHFNVMDGLDIYIDDYSKPDPLPLPMLRRMASAQFLNLVDQEPQSKAAPGVQPHAPLTDVPPVAATAAEGSASPTAADTAPDRSATRPPVTAAGEQPPGSLPTTEDHADTDLRLQQDHAAGAQGSGRSPG